MQTNYLQYISAINADRITNLHIEIGDALDQAKWYKEQGEASFAIEEYALADRLRKKLAKAVEVQNAVKVQMAYNVRMARTGKIIAGMLVDAMDDLISYEQEQEAAEIGQLPIDSKL